MIGVKAVLLDRSTSEKVGARDDGLVDNRNCISIVSIIIGYKVYSIPVFLLIKW